MKKKGIIIIDWEKTYHENKKHPFDLKVFYDQLETIFYDYQINTLKETFYEHQNNSVTTPNSHKKNHTYINIDQIFKPDKTSEKTLLEFIALGNTAFISANQFSTTLLDSLGVKNNYRQQHFNQLDTVKLHLQDSVALLNYKPKLKHTQYYFKDSSNIKNMGYITTSTNDSLAYINFVKIPYKFGCFYLHTQPEIFTNYELLKAENTTYINHLLSLITKDTPNSYTLNPNTKDKHIYFQSNYLANQKLIKSPLRFIRASKRKQRSIPIIPKVKNTSLEFIETIATLYEDTDNYQPLIKQKIHVFYRNIRNRYQIITDNTNKKFINQLSNKSGYDFEKTKELIRFINAIKNRDTSSISLLKKLNFEIENFYKNTATWKN